MTWKYGILKKLHSSELRGHLPIFIKNFLSNRKIRVKVQNTYSDEYDTEQGVPQGSVMSCTNFAVGIDGCLSGLPADVKSTLYVDDLMIYCSSKRQSKIERALQNSIKILEKWCGETGFSFSAAKTVAMHICRKRGCPKTAHNLTLNQEPIPSREEHKYLGLKVDNGLRWNSHVKQLKKDCNNRMNLLKHLSHTTWGADMKSLKMLYNTLIKSKLEYGSEIYESTSYTSSKSLYPVRNAALRLATGAFRSSPINSLEIITGSMPIEYTKEIKLLNYLTRIKVNDSNPINNILPNITNNPDDYVVPRGPRDRSFVARSQKALVNSNLDINNITKENMQANPPWITKNISVCKEVSQYVKKDIPAQIMKNMFLCHMREHDNSTYKLYTDGSKTEQGVAYGIYSENYQASERLPNDTSIFTAELYGILEAIKYGEDVPEENVLLVTDSRSSIQAVQKLFSTNQLVQKIQNIVGSSVKNYTFCWVPSHIGVHGNEEADKLAVQATIHPIIAQYQYTRSDAKAYIMKTYKEKWRQKWMQSEPKKLREITESIYPLPNSSCENRQWERCLARLRIGHSKLTHGHLMSREQPPTCEDCGEDFRLTIKHILSECPALNNKRRQFCGSANRTMKQLLNKGDTSYGGSLYKFITNINLLNKL